MQNTRALPQSSGRAAARSAARVAGWSDVLVGVLLLVIMGVGGWLRYTGLNWDDFTHLHPDERFLTQVVSSLDSSFISPTGDDASKAQQLNTCMERYPDTNGVGGYFDALCSTWNPHNVGYGLYVYGTLPLFIARQGAEAFAFVSERVARDILLPQTGDPIWENYNGGYWLSYDGIHLVWRFLSAAAEMGCVFICFLIGRRLHDKWVGLVAAALYSVTVFSIQIAHFGTVDAISSFFTSLAMLFAVGVQRKGGLENYLGFGLAFGFALASRINLAPLVGVIMLAAGMQALPAFDGRMIGSERRKLIAEAFVGVALAGVVSIVIFRLLNPYAFTGPGILGLSLNGRWLADLGTAQALVSGAVDSPPNFQWVSRAAYLYPLNNMILWGMGAAFGVAAWLSFGWALWRLIRGKPGATANIILVAWVLVYFGFLGRQWVTTMRYFLPIYGSLAVLAAWGLLALLRGASLNVRVGALRRLFGSLLLIGVVGFTALWALMFTNIYRSQLTRVQASHWVWENVPADFAMRLDGADMPWIQVPVNNENIPRQRRSYDAIYPNSTNTFTVPQAGILNTVNAIVFDDYSEFAREAAVRVAIRDETGNTLSSETIRYSFSANGIGAPIPISIPLTTPVPVQPGAPYTLSVELVEGDEIALGDFTTFVEPNPPTDFPTMYPSVVIPVTSCSGSTDDLARRVTCYDVFRATTVSAFVAPADGTISRIHAPRLGDPLDDPEPETLQFTIQDEATGEILARARLSQDLPRDQHVTGSPYDIPLETPIQVQSGRRYQLRVDLIEGGPVLSGGSIFTWEGAWDDPIPTKVCEMPFGVTLADDPPPGLNSYPQPCNGLDPWWSFITGYELDIVYEDVPDKRTRLIEHLNNSDYIAISSNRFYDTLSRNPMRWRMTNVYYDALFSGELGFDLVATFQETFELGPLRISDQVLPTYDVPDWLNEFEAEEAFHVYDHPVVFIFQKAPDYDPQTVRDILYSVPIVRIQETPVIRACPEYANVWYCDPTLSGVIALSSDQADQAATQLRLSEDMQRIQYEGDSWSDRFDADSPISLDPVVSTLAFWLATAVFGVAAFPLFMTIFPRLADRGYGLAKFGGMFLVAWGTWYLSSVQVPVWSQAGIAGGIVVLFVLGVVAAWRTRADVIGFLREGWRRLVIIELLTLLLFLGFLVVRASNPDLWHPSFGGEKPMDFAYFNGVLRSTIFPPLDPWHAGGFINYYYFGFVIVGAPVLLLQMTPSVAYNLIVPMLFAMTGVGALSVTFSIVHHFQSRREDDEADGLPASRKPRPYASPWLAGIMALLLAVGLGNLDTARIFFTGVARLGGYIPPAGMESYLVDQFTLANSRSPDESEFAHIMEQGRNPSIVDTVRYEFDNVRRLLVALGGGIQTMTTTNAVLPIGSERWFWGPTRIYAETPGVEGQAITEMPIFTYIYGDLHAHMISMPMQYLVMAFLLNELLLARAKRRRLALVLAVLLGGITVGMLRATNTWDWITYLLVGAAGLAFAWWLNERRRGEWLPLTRRALTHAALYVGGFAVVTFVAVMPFTSWFASAYNRVLPWEGGKAPIWAYLTIHGLFLLLLLGLLFWDTGRWFRSTRVGTLRGACLPLLIGLIVTLGVWVGAAVLAVSSRQVQIGLIVLPLLWWIVVLFFRQGQTRVMQFVLALAGAALALTLGVEIVVLDGDIGRQNTVFKFYLQAWLMLAVVGGAAFAWLWRGSLRWSGGLRFLYYVPLALLITLAAAFPLMAARGKAVFRFDTNQPFTLDGAAFMNYATQFEFNNEVLALNPTAAPFTLAEDYALIRWLQENVEGTPTIVEGLSEGTEYKWNARISIYTGLPAVIGWNWHQRQQRGLNEMGRMVELRAANVNAFYLTRNIEQAWDFLRWYDVRYIIVGRLEQAYYPPDSLAKFDRMVEQGLLEAAFSEGESTIYRVIEGAVPLELG
jgi:YYY domain-containing protein